MWVIAAFLMKDSCVSAHMILEAGGFNSRRLIRLPELLVMLLN